MYVFPNFLKKMADGGILSLNPSSVIQVMLMDVSYVPSSSHEFVSDVVANEMSGSGYSRWTLSGKTLAITGTDVMLDATDIYQATGPSSGQTGGYLVYSRITNDADSPVMLFSDDDPDFPINFASNPGNPFSITFPATGVLRLVGGAS